MSKRECASCEFFSGGNCRRYPPRVVPYPNDNQHPVFYTPSEWWPSVSAATDWCGEYRLAAALDTNPF